MKSSLVSTAEQKRRQREEEYIQYLQGRNRRLPILDTDQARIKNYRQQIPSEAPSTAALHFDSSPITQSTVTTLDTPALVEPKEALHNTGLIYLHEKLSKLGCAAEMIGNLIILIRVLN